MKNNFESKFIQNLIHLNYGLRVKAEQIEGELDDNFKLNCDGNMTLSEFAKWFKDEHNIIMKST